jgi:GT2 family glycosyltransferase
LKRPVKLSIVIVNYNVKYFLEQCLRSATKAVEGIESQIFVVDNNSVDGSNDMVRSKFPQVTLIANEENHGFSKANNQAIRLSEAEYILLLNPDTVIQEDTVRRCINYMDNHDDCGALGVKMIDGNGKFLPESKRGLPTPEVALYKMLGLNKLFPKSRKFGKYHLGYLPENEVNEVEVLAGAFMMLRKSVLDKIGLLDETFFMYGEDVDLSYRIGQAGYKNVYFPETSIIHYKGESTKKASANYVFVFYRAMIIFSKKHYNDKSAKLLNTFINGAIYLRALFAMLQRFFSKYWLVFADALLMVLGLFLLKDYWEEHVKIKTHPGFTQYPKELITIHFPYYVTLWISSMFISGGAYQKPYSVKRIIRGIAIGTILIAAIHGILPNNLRFSRAIFLFGAAAGGISTIGLRLIIHAIRNRNLDLGSRQKQNTIIVGNGTEQGRVYSMMMGAGMQTNFMGFVEVASEGHSREKLLGNISQLDEIVNIYEIGEIIFCGKDVKSSEIIQWMAKIGRYDLKFKIVPEESLFIIGSDSSNSSGEFYTEEISFDLSKNLHRTNKRFVDIGLSLFLLLASPVLSWYKKNPLKYLRNCFQVLFGAKTWVGYDKIGDCSYLPKLKQGVISVCSTTPDNVMNPEVASKLNFFYARHYFFDKDFSLVMKNLRIVGS